MPEVQPRVVTDKAKISAVSAKIGKPVLALVEIPATKEDEQIISAGGLKEGDLISLVNFGVLGSVHTHSGSCTVSGPVPFDCSVDWD